MSKKAFEKFINKEPKGAAKKEQFRQEKRKAKAELKAIGEEMRKKKKLQDVQSTKSKIRNPKIENKKFSQGSANNKQTRPTTFSQNFTKKTELQTTNYKAPTTTSLMPLNKFIAHAGICSRREAAELIKDGLVTVNKQPILEPGFKVTGKEDIKLKGKPLYIRHNLIYILLNKPKDYITTAKDPQGRKTVFDLIKNAAQERVYPVGRLDRNTTGVLLLTNDGELTQKLTHPSYEIKKIYEVKLDKPVTKKDMEAIASGITLDDGFIQADSIAYADTKDKSVVGIEIHSGRNRIVRRIFECLGYDVKNLDRVMFANLTKKDVERGKWRMLQEKEIRLLKFMNKSFVRKGK
ncbi:MAG: rRNA pseudouridine synthase [Chitinophagaceae bacterium]|nr:rRNA pseudouridine synthase [Chitinophagaceae bacterium]MCW5904346.1 rRNA pseudouridine synthase [Chitinophagaceae bacterium]